MEDVKKQIQTDVEDVDRKALVQKFQEYVAGQSQLCPDNVNLMEIFPQLLKLQNDKGRVYGRSYAKHGDVSIFLNVERKFDRISNIMDRAMREGLNTLHSEASSTATETFLDTVVDLGLYSLVGTAGCTYFKLRLTLRPKYTITCKGENYHGKEERNCCKQCRYYAEH